MQLDADLIKAFATLIAAVSPIALALLSRPKGPRQ